MIIKFNVDLKTVRKVFAILEQDIPSDDEIIDKMENKVVDLTNIPDEDTKQAELAFVLMAIGQLYE